MDQANDDKKENCVDGSRQEMRGCPIMGLGGAPFPEEDGIDLVALFWVLLKRKWLIMGTAAVVTLGAIAYALLATPVYKVDIGISPPRKTDIQELSSVDIQQMVGINVTPSTAFSAFKLDLESKQVRRKIFDEMGLRKLLDDNGDLDQPDDWFFDDFNEAFSIQYPEVDEEKSFISPQIIFSMEAEDPVLTARVVNNLVGLAEQTAIQELTDDVRSVIEQRDKELTRDIQLLQFKVEKQRLDEIERLSAADVLAREDLQDQIDTARQFAEQRRLDRIVQFEEAILIARKLSINEPIDFKLKKIGAATTENSQIMTGLDPKGSQLYERGYEALDAEVEQLKNRASNDPFIPELQGLLHKLKLLEENRKIEQLSEREDDDPYIATLRDKEGELAKLKGIEIDSTKLHSARVDQPAHAPKNRLKPKRTRIVIVGGFVGGVLGCALALLVNFIAVRKNEE